MTGWIGKTAVQLGGLFSSQVTSDCVGSVRKSNMWAWMVGGDDDEERKEGRRGLKGETKMLGGGDMV